MSQFASPSQYRQPSHRRATSTTSGLSISSTLQNSPSSASAHLPITPTTPIQSATTAAQPQQPGLQASAPASATDGQSQQHKRVYQACIPCRRRKVRCDLGSVDNPHDPPCVRCRRESKECYFSATRRKRKTEDGEGSVDGEDDYVMRNGRKRVNINGSPPAIDRRMYSDVPLTPGGSAGRSQPLRRPDGKLRRSGELGVGDEPNAQLENLEARTVMRTGMYGPHDALDLLYKAATDDSPAMNHKRDPSSSSIPPQSVVHPSFMPGKSPVVDRSSEPKNVKTEQIQIDPELECATDLGTEESLKAWSRFRFVRAGWFTAQEAIAYIEYYYEYLSPLTPISPPTFRNPGSHITLLTEEPVLTVTLLTIASRYRRLPGPGGHCRSHAIHEQLWTYLRGMIERCFWGQEAFGGGVIVTTGVPGTGEDGQTSSTEPSRGLRKGSLRTLGTIESLMILTEWHPRALHFPPAEAIYELMVPAVDTASEYNGPDDDGMTRPATGVRGRRLESWLEPAWRSDRMCWMLLSTAMGLAYELGVFDDIEELLRDGEITRPEYKDEPYRQRASRIKRLLNIYLTQLAGRLNWTNMVPEGLRKSDPAISRRRPTSNEGATPATNASSFGGGFNYIPDLELDDQIIHCWAGISNAMHIGNLKLFKSRKHTTEIIQNGKYIDLLKEFQPMLKEWFKEFERFRMPLFIRHILTIEYEYVRIYINSLSLQAVVERSTNNAGNTATGPGGSTTGSVAQLSPQTQNYYGKLPLGHIGGLRPEDQNYIKEVIDGSRNLLKTVVEGLLPNGFLKHAPVRTYFRIISGAMFLLKTFALGAPRSDVKISIDLMDRAVDALRTCVVDDVHLGTRFADLLESLTTRLRNRFIQAPSISQAAGSPMPNNSDVVMQNGSGVGNGDWASKVTAGLSGPGSPHAGGISATPYDLRGGNFPYQSGAASVLNPSTPSASDPSAVLPGTMMDDWAGQEMWYLPPGPGLYQNMDNNAVAMTAEGVSVGGIDLLDYMTMDPGSFPGMEGY